MPGQGSSAALQRCEEWASSSMRPPLRGQWKPLLCLQHGYTSGSPILALEVGTSCHTSSVVWSSTALVPKYRVALGTSTVASYLVSMFGPMMQGSCMLAKQNLWSTVQVETVIWRDLFPTTLARSPVTAVIRRSVGFKSCGLGPSIPGRVLVQTRDSLDPASRRQPNQPAIVA